MCFPAQVSNKNRAHRVQCGLFALKSCDEDKMKGNEGDNTFFSTSVEVDFTGFTGISYR